MQLITAFLGTLGFGILFNIRGKKLWLAALGGFLSWGFFLLLGLWIEGEPVRYFLCSVLVSVYAEILARVVKTPTTTFIIISLIPLVPGGSLYYTMASALEGNGQQFLDNGVHTLSLAIALSLGIILVTSFVRRLKILKK
ncbi:MAG: threonine/serine exporter family protein [Clostridia bacterium]|nr:threonine/serine exporter family protein [Clostridia bacterium]